MGYFLGYQGTGVFTEFLHDSDGKVVDLGSSPFFDPGVRNRIFSESRIQSVFLRAS
jgi:hypothetical protein